MRAVHRPGRSALLPALLLGLALLLLLPAGCAQEDPTDDETDTQAPTALAEPSVVTGLSGGEQETITLYGSDDTDEVDELYMRVVDEPEKGELDKSQGFAPLDVVYTRNRDASGSDSFSYTATDSSGNTSNPAFVGIKASE